MLFFDKKLLEYTRRATQYGHKTTQRILDNKNIHLAVILASTSACVGSLFYSLYLIQLPTDGLDNQSQIERQNAMAGSLVLGGAATMTSMFFFGYEAGRSSIKEESTAPKLNKNTNYGIR
jgi:hypothetical protein